MAGLAWGLPLVFVSQYSKVINYFDGKRFVKDADTRAYQAHGKKKGAETESERARTTDRYLTQVPPLSRYLNQGAVKLNPKL